MTLYHHLPHRLLLDHGGGISCGNPHTSEANFDTNMVVILAALLCALICALGLNSIARCILRCSGSSDYDTRGEAATRATTTGLKKSTLRRIPVAAYCPEMSFPGSDCSICLGEFVDGERVRVLPICNHGFHVRCIDTWLVSHSSCPTCRQSLIEIPTCSEDGIMVRDHGNVPAGGERQADIAVVTVDE